ncbi:hypothetical protein BGZ63DRAFT_371412 [Mariannaea sp. PMI_226]|nr:hypothetical protein BGZ63DRAFT_371412 [Mariannaea sp. PMI_226]
MERTYIGVLRGRILHSYRFRVFRVISLGCLLLLFPSSCSCIAHVQNAAPLRKLHISHPEWGLAALMDRGSYIMGGQEGGYPPDILPLTRYKSSSVSDVQHTKLPAI